MNIQRESGGGLDIDFSLIPLDAQAAVAGNNSNEQHTGGGRGSCPTFTIEMQGQHSILPFSSPVFLAGHGS